MMRGAFNHPFDWAEPFFLYAEGDMPSYCWKTRLKVAMLPKPDCPAGLENFYNAKYLYFVFASDELSDIGNDGIITRLEGIYKKFAPMYRFLRDVSDDYFKTHQ